MKLTYPVAPFYSLKADADLWAEFIPTIERKIFLVALWEALSDEDKKRFLMLVKKNGQGL